MFYVNIFCWDYFINQPLIIRLYSLSIYCSFSPLSTCRPLGASSTCCVSSSTHLRMGPSCRSSMANTPSLRTMWSTLCITTSYVSAFILCLLDSVSPSSHQSHWFKLLLCPKVTAGQIHCHLHQRKFRIAPLNITFIRTQLPKMLWQSEELALLPVSYIAVNA